MAKVNFKIAKRIMIPAAQMLPVAVLNALAGKPVDDFVVADDHGPGAFGNRHRIAHVIAVAVRDQNVIGLHFVGCGRRRRVAGKKRIDQQLRAVDIQPHRRVTIPR